MANALLAAIGIPIGLSLAEYNPWAGVAFAALSLICFGRILVADYNGDRHEAR